ncbi:PAS domain-containing protein [Phnomibacter ginsenosidimutans]|uniref:histidine kinase n=1 Tax=Phnomibacter ginsenosidimutans TaxID=2676868 RepID=A0A6I6G4T2_9BACT|nr:PAS domain-containing protein [Phnomibacter ginsenosidimutans]QGW27666.1 PAS domain-containing protein [Phnomibacter ginsenosidimutans]
MELVDTAFSKHIEYRSDFNIIFRIITAKKTLKYVHEKCRTEFDAQGRPVRTIGIVMDITKQRLAELALKEEQQNYQSLIQYAPVGMVAISEDEHVFLGNKKFQQLTGYKPYDIDSLQDWWEKAYPSVESKKSAQKNWEIILSNNGKRKSPVPNIESVIVCKDGSLKNVEIGYVFTGKVSPDDVCRHYTTENSGRNTGYQRSQVQKNC